MREVRALLEEAVRDFTLTGNELDRTVGRARRRASRQRRVAVLTALVVAAAGVGLALWAFLGRAPTRPADLQGNGAIFFVRLVDESGPFGGDLYRVNEDGTRLTRLTTSGDVSANIAVSPDGSMVAFVRREAKVYVIGSTGAGLRQLAGVFDDRGVVVNGRSSTIQWPSWTPDGKRVRFYANPGTIEGQTGRPRQGLWEVGVDGSDPRLVIPNWHPWYPAWSPDGTIIAWIGDRGTGTGREDLFVSAPNGVQERRRLTTDPANAEMAAWSPNGEQIAFVNGGAVDVITPDGTGRRTLFECGTSCDGLLWAAWSPDGTNIVFTASVGTRLELRVMNSDGTNVHRIPGVLGACCPSWQPIATTTSAPG